jgi:DNA-binding transcriptional regulator YiaG
LKKIHASSDTKYTGEDLLPAETLWRAAQLIRQGGTKLLPIDAKPAPEEMLGLTIGILRRRKHISKLQFAQTIGCSLEELLALEAGGLPLAVVQKYLPQIIRELEVSSAFLHPLLNCLKFA